MINKKASLNEITDIFRLLFVIVVFFSLLLTVRAFIVQKIEIKDVESKLLAYRVMLSKDLNYVDSDINRAYIGTIDLQKFTSPDFGKNILNSIYYGKDNSEASAKLTLRDITDGKEYETFYNKELYDEKKVLVEARLTGAGAATKTDETFYVMIMDSGKLKRGVLNIDAILPNS